MSSRSRTGLLSTPKKTIHLNSKTKENEVLPQSFRGTAVPLVLRPLGGLYNPFDRGCSILCNHPAPRGIKDIIKKTKVLMVESRSTNILDGTGNNFKKYFGAERIPEDLFRRYTDTDSRPLTPRASIVHGHDSRISAMLSNSRRCKTPELRKTEIFTRKKIILDLRRSHSQESLYWRTGSDLSQSFMEDGKPKLPDRTELKSETKEPCTEFSLITYNEKEEKESVEALKTRESHKCINENDLEEGDVRRGKRRKKIKAASEVSTFHLSRDPETQVAALGPDSPNQSTRPSLIPNSQVLLPNRDNNEEEKLVITSKSFLPDMVFQMLKAELNLDSIENTFGRYLNRALREAMKFVNPIPIKSTQMEEQKNQSGTVEPHKTPRKLSKSVSRFDVPLDTTCLESMSVLEYLGQFVWVSNQRKQFYKTIFVKYLINVELISLNEDLTRLNTNKKSLGETSSTRSSTTSLHGGRTQSPQPASFTERRMNPQHIRTALKEVLCFYGTDENVSQILEAIDWKPETNIELDFRTWCGICAFAERYAINPNTENDSADELEKSDFDTLVEHLESTNISKNLQHVFIRLQQSHKLD